MRKARPQLCWALRLSACSFVLLYPADSRATEPSERIPVVGLHLQPTLSLTLAASKTAAVVHPYGVAQPTGVAGLDIQLNRRVGLLVELEAQAWSGTYRGGEGGDLPLRLLNYWIQCRARTQLFEVGPIRLLLDGIVGAVVGREDGPRFRAEGAGLVVGAGPVALWPVGDYVAFSLSLAVEGGWMWHHVQSPQTSQASGSYLLTWPRIVLGLGVHAYLAHRVQARRRPERSAHQPTVAGGSVPRPPPLESPFSAPEPESAPPAPTSPPLEAPW